eukprot:TRINITY_DN105612_c0_g1_i1.p2 TRINITY_DN105612_c0_g1~~TRINITY_DN105612_c0_g1_i1.p2  ORF type:complete len:216 (-),score=39.07 TRINITY_DN105612_c0_g1_i1:29-640(-)
MSSTWDHRFLELASHISCWSKDPSTKVGCVVVGPDREIRSTGFNGLPRGIEDSEERLTNRQLKYPLICHAEENAIMHAARIGVALKGCTAFVTWPPCTRCARSLLQAGVTEVVSPKGVVIPERWMEDFNMSRGMLSEAGVVVREVGTKDEADKPCAAEARAATPVATPLRCEQSVRTRSRSRQRGSDGNSSALDACLGANEDA